MKEKQFLPATFAPNILLLHNVQFETVNIFYFAETRGGVSYFCFIWHFLHSLSSACRKSAWCRVCVSKWPWIIVYWSFIISIPRVKIDHCTIMDGDCLSVHFQLRQHHGIVFKLSF